ncbi:ATG16 [Candida pseudojiufengensis]|uniref:ATG16 n=1 Tax=Candida pseudojiufengensis TaxID=497109 RepID=UPI0022258360|nr:ATG16 [Candida pseudojiufengensis]KAI5964223.1 ATG16 [Candida pseudojiufengensis]
MNKDNWSDDILDKLKLRDEVEKKDSEYFIAYQQLMQKLDFLKQQIYHNDSSYSSKSPSPSALLNIEPQQQPSPSNPERDINFIVKENQQLRNENHDLITNLNSVTLKNERLESIAKEKDLNIKKLEKLNTNLSKKIENLLAELKEKNKTIELINDENLMNQIQLNVLLKKSNQN